ncbi:hypothetical protein DPEC_G00243070 [Dallia pectoralis]|uniref:Uncharacterized protein n=1 Tax=Dallia pectoralis TaxID=75939 RepID=A0ACC2FVG6_DALPE|nr:hypothetical protein DPEC_G00243070 [Dallia pectoralis]
MSNLLGSSVSLSRSPLMNVDHGNDGRGRRHRSRTVRQQARSYLDSCSRPGETRASGPLNGTLTKTSGKGESAASRHTCYDSAKAL